MEDLHIAVEFDERTIRALHSAVAMTLEKWTGQGEVDQEALFTLKTLLQKAILEFNLNKSFN